MNLSQHIPDEVADQEENLKASLEAGKGLGIEPVDEALLLSYWAESLRYSYREGNIPRDRYASLYVQTLQARSQNRSVLTLGDPAPKYDLLKSHYPKLIGLGAMSGEEPGMSIRLRPAIHGEQDHPWGYNPGSLLSILDTKVGVTGDSIFLDKLTLVHIASWKEQTSMMKPWSWEVEAGYNRMQQELAATGLMGKSWQLGKGNRVILLGGPRVSDLDWGATGFMRIRIPFGLWHFSGKGGYRLGKVRRGFEGGGSIVRRFSGKGAFSLSGQGGVSQMPQVTAEYLYYL